MRILYIIPWIPYPLSSGGAQAFFNYANALRHDNDTTLLLSIHNNEEDENAEKLKAVWPDVHIIKYDFRSDWEYMRLAPPHDDFSSKTRTEIKWLNKIKNSCERKIMRRLNKSHKPIYLDSNSKICLRNEAAVLYNENRDMTSGYLGYVQKVASQDFDVIQVEFYESLPLVYVLPKNVKKIFVHHEIRFVHNDDEMRLFKQVTAKDRYTYATQKAMELDALSKYDRIVVLSDVDKKIIKKYLPNADVCVSPAMTQAMIDERKELQFTPCRDLVFVGNSNHLPNVEGIMWFLTDVMPKLISNGYNGTVWVTGKWDHGIQHAMQEASDKVKFAGFVDDLPSFLNGKITLVPIRIGGGIRMKILDSVASYSPIVSTVKGCEGLPLRNGENSFVTDDADEFSQSILQLSNDTELQQRLAANAKNCIRAEMNPQLLLETRKKTYEDGNDSYSSL